MYRLLQLLFLQRVLTQRVVQVRRAVQAREAVRAREAAQVREAVQVQEADFGRDLAGIEDVGKGVGHLQLHPGRVTIGEAALCGYAEQLSGEDGEGSHHLAPYDSRHTSHTG